MENEKVSIAKVKELSSDAPKSGFAEIRLKNPKRTGSITVRGYNGEDGNYRPFVDKNGNHRIQRMTKKRLLNLSNVDDQLLYEQVRLHPIYVMGANPVLSLHNHETEAEEFVTKKDLQSKADHIIAKLKSNELYDFARILLVPVKKGSSDNTIKRSLYEISTHDPIKIINEWDDPSKELKSILLTGIEKDVFTKIGGVYKFKGSVMGTSFELAIEWLRDNDDLIPSIRKEIKK
jgi:hypothetical protein